MITIYTIPGDIDCERTKIFLKMRDYPFKEVGVSQNKKPIKRIVFRNLGQYELPIVDIDGKYVFMGEVKKT